MLESNPVKFELEIGESKTLDLTSDQKLYVQVNGIGGSAANIFVKTIVQIPLQTIVFPEKEEKMGLDTITTKAVSVEEVEKAPPLTLETKKPPIALVVTTLVIVIALAGSFVIMKGRKKITGGPHSTE